MPGNSGRKFAIVDGMILVAATAGGLALAREVLPAWSPNNRWWYWWCFSLPMGGGTPLVAGWSIGLLACRLRMPRPRFRRLFRQPGAGANLVALAVFAIWTAMALIKAMMGRKVVMDIFTYTSIGSGAAVLGVWLILSVTRTMSLERSWLDRSGIAVGICWISLMFITLVEALLF